MSDKDDDQLLQDASTLLMFANVAAKQQQNHTLEARKLSDGAQTSEEPRKPSFEEARRDNHSLEGRELPNPTSPLQVQTQNIQKSPIQVSPTQSQLPRLNQMPYYGFPQQQRLANSFQPQPQDLPQNTSVMQSPPAQLATLPPLQRPIQPSIPHIVPIQHNQPSPPDQKLLPPQFAPRKMVKISPKQPVRRGSISLLMNNDQTPPLQVDQSLLGKQKTVSPPSNSNTADQTHKRSQSHPEIGVNKLLLISPKQSPVQKGINLQTGERDTTNAMIAAAALAAAAEVPFPLKHDNIIHTQPSNQPIPTLPEPIKPNKRKSPVSRKSSPLVKKPARKQSPAQKKDKKQQLQELIVEPPKPLESAATLPTKLTPDEETEPEDDERTDDEREDVKREEFNIPPFESYKAEPDSVLIECICGIEEDDGFTVQCDICYRWQHCHCMGFTDSDELPDIYKCYYCDKLKWGKFDPRECQQNTINRLNPNRKGQPKRKQLGSEKSDDKSVNSSSLSNGSNGSNDQPTSKRRKVSESSDKREVPDVQASPQALTLPIKDNELLKDGVSAESYESVYYNLKENDYKRGQIRDLLADKGAQFYGEFLALLKVEQSKKTLYDVDIMSPQQFKAIKFAKIFLPNYQKYMSENFKNIINKNKKHNKFTIKVRPYSDNQKQKFNGISKLSLFISSNDELTIPEDTPIIEYLGEIDLFENYANDATNQYPIWGTTKPKVLKTTIMTPEKLSVVLDSRFVGNESRFIRNACPAAANCRIKQIYIPETKSFKFIVVTSKDIVLKSNEMDEELRLSWEWDPKHPILQLYENNEKFELLLDNSKRALIAYVDNILYFVECGCSTSNLTTSCALFKVKKATAYLLRSTRKASSISNINLTKSKDELIFSQESKRFVSWDDRLTERDNRIEFNLLVTTKNVSLDQEKSPNSKDEIESSKAAEIKPAMLMKIPYKEQLLAKRKNVISEDNDSQMDIDEDSVSKTDENETPKILPFPVVAELAIKIEKSIDDTLKPIEAEIKGTLTEHGKVTEIVQEEAPVKVATAANSTTAEHKAPPKDDVSNTLEEKIELKQTAESSEPKPTVVKKLSFADYKKKLK